MAMHTFEATQFLPTSLREAWDFISSPKNLQRITPPQMGFKIVDKTIAEKMFVGQIINYSVKPILGIPLRWTSEITHLSELDYFIDEQRKGPYSFWQHRHILKETTNGVELKDIVHYKVPLWIAGDLLNKLFVRKKIEEIFEYRFEKLEEIFQVKR